MDLCWQVTADGLPTRQPSWKVGSRSGSEPPRPGPGEGCL